MMTTLELSATGLATRVNAAERQAVPWDRPDELAQVCDLLRARPPLVCAVACHALLDELRSVASSRSFAIQAGDCAELFRDSQPDRIEAKAAQLEQLADLFEATCGVPVVRIGRFAGQYAKPRSSPVEALPDGTVVPSYRGDAVNELEPTAAARRADPWRLLAAYDHAAAAMDALFLNRFLPVGGGLIAGTAPTCVSHEALLLDYERAMLRPSQVLGGPYVCSAHFVWIGERTRQLDGPHMAFAAQVTNPIGVKLGPSVRPDYVVSVVERLATGHPPGRLSLICRFGARLVAESLPPIVRALGERAHDVVWMCDPMHGNTRVLPGGQKTRVVDDVLDEVAGFVTALAEHGVWPGGLHLEITPEAVTECIDSHDELTNTTELPRYRSACDPRLDPAQARRVAGAAARRLATVPADGR